MIKGDKVYMVENGTEVNEYIYEYDVGIDNTLYYIHPENKRDDFMVVHKEYVGKTPIDAINKAIKVNLDMIMKLLKLNSKLEDIKHEFETRNGCL